MFGKSQDPANRIYMSAAALRTVLDASDKKNPFENMIGGASDYITQVNSAMNLTVIFRMLGVGLLLTLVASLASVLFIMRYDPLKILANRD